MAFTVVARDVVAGGSLRAVPEGARRHVAARLTFDSSYPTGGESVTAAQLGLNTIDALTVGCSASGKTAAAVPQADGSVKIKLFATYATEAANASDQSTETVEVYAVGV